MKTKSLLWCMLAVMTVGMTGLSLTSCGGDDDGVDPDSGTPVKPEAKVDDPTGTISLSMRNDNNGTTYLDDIYINRSDNFYGAYFASVGAVNGLGNVSVIPTAGWANQVAVKPGVGYVAYDHYRSIFYRIYVENYIEGVSGGVIGADVKYQKPFKGKDEAIKITEGALAFDADGGTQTLTFTNSTIIPFTYESSEDWCHVYTSSTNAANIPDGIAIQVDAHNAATSTEAIVKLITSYGRETTVKVVRGARGPYVQIGTHSGYFAASAQTQTFPVAGNVDVDKLKVTTDQDWCTASIEDISDAMYARADKVLYVNSQPVTRAGADNNDAKAYLLIVDVTNNYDEEQRFATVVVESTDGKAGDTMGVSQDGSYNYLSVNASELELAVDAGTATIGYSTSLPREELVVKSNAAWCQAKLDETSNSILVSYESNTTTESRTAVVTLSSKSGKRTATVRLVQQAPYLNVSKSEVNFDKNRNNVTITLTTNKTDWEATSSDESWCTFSQNGNQITIRSTEATEDRTATITFKNFNTTIVVHQSKYAVGNEYDENGISGTVSYIGDDGRWIRQYVGQAAWSTEEVSTGATSLTDGEYNMGVIKKISGWEELYPAFKLVDDLNVNGVQGWILPAGYARTGQVPLVDKGSELFWSSTEDDARYAFCNWNYEYSSSKSVVRNVYAIHSF